MKNVWWYRKFSLNMLWYDNNVLFFSIGRSVAYWFDIEQNLFNFNYNIIFDRFRVSEKKLNNKIKLVLIKKMLY